MCKVITQDHIRYSCSKANQEKINQFLKCYTKQEMSEK